MNYSSRFFLYAPIGLFLALALGVSLHWWILASALSSRLKELNGHEIVPGVTIQYSTHTISGFPFSLDTVFHGITFTVATPYGPMQWHADAFAMHALTYGRDETIFEAAGPQMLRWTREDRIQRALPFAVGSLHASSILDKAGLARFDFDLVGFGSKDVTAQRLQFHVRRNGHGNLDVVGSVNDLRPSQGSCPGLGDQLSKAELAGTVTEAVAFKSLLAGRQGWDSAVAGWRAAGGNFLVDSLVLPREQSRVSQLRTAIMKMPADELTTVSGLADALCRR
jgi:hypothetical protein